METPGSSTKNTALITAAAKRSTTARKVGSRSRSMPKYTSKGISIPKVGTLYMKKRKFLNHKEIQQGLQKGKVEELVCLCDRECCPPPLLCMRRPKGGRLGSAVSELDYQDDLEVVGSDSKAELVEAIQDSNLNAAEEVESLVSIQHVVASVASKPALLEEGVSDSDENDRAPRTCCSVPNTSIPFETKELISSNGLLLESGENISGLGLMDPQLEYTETETMPLMPENEAAVASGDDALNGGDSLSQSINANLTLSGKAPSTEATLKNVEPEALKSDQGKTAKVNFYFKVVSPRCRCTKAFHLCPVVDDPANGVRDSKGFYQIPPNYDVEFAEGETYPYSESESDSDDEDEDDQYDSETTDNDSEGTK